MDWALKPRSCHSSKSDVIDIMPLHLRYFFLFLMSYQTEVPIMNKCKVILLLERKATLTLNTCPALSVSGLQFFTKLCTLYKLMGLIYFYNCNKLFWGSKAAVKNIWSKYYVTFNIIAQTVLFNFKDYTYHIVNYI